MRRLRMALLWVLLALAAAAIAGGVYFRAVGSDPVAWHADPLAGARTGKPNDVLVLPPGAGAADIESPVYLVPAADLAARLDAVASAEPRTARLAGSPAEGRVTYVQRSALWGFPDYVSAAVVDLGDGRSALALWSRSRFGHSDLGVNRARAERWIAALGDLPRG